MIYFDNCATTYPKPLSVRRAVAEAMEKYGANSGRGGFQMSMKTSEKIYECRENVSSLFNVSDPSKVAFTLNCTMSLNMAIKGLVRHGDHIIISDLEHNAVARPVDAMAQRGYISYSVAKYSENPEETVMNFKKLINKKTKLIVCLHTSNVFGVTMPIKELGQLAADNGLYFVVDAAQSAGVLPIDMADDNITVLCMPGHKGLYGPMGTGVIAVNNDDCTFNTIIEGGTGSNSSMLEQPDFMPDLFESGTVNTSGIVGLNAGISFIKSQSIEKIRRHEYLITDAIYNEISRNDNIQLYLGKPKFPEISPIISMNFKDYHSEKAASLLSEKGIAVRAGYHCAYAAHSRFGTQERGTVRVSPSAFTSMKEAMAFCAAAKRI